MKYFSNILRTTAMVIMVFLFTILPAIPAQAAQTISIAPTAGKAETEVIIHATGFSPSLPGYDKMVDIYFSKEVAALDDLIDTKVKNYYKMAGWRIEETGNFTAPFTIPYELNDGAHHESLAGGTYYLYFTMTGNKGIIAMTTFTAVVPTATLTPDNGGVGTKIKIAGVDFTPNQQVTLYYDGADVTSSILPLGAASSTLDGNISCTLPAPTSFSGIHTLLVRVGNEQAITKFTIKPTIGLSITSGKAGDSIGVSGTGFQASGLVAIDFGATKDWGSTSTDSTGQFGVNLNIPATATPGVFDIKATDEFGTSAAAQFTIALNLSLTPATSTAAPGYAGMEVEFKGTNLKPNTPISITFAPLTTPIATAATDGQGAFSVKFKIPATAGGPHIITASDGVTNAQVTFTMESTPPTPPVLSLPVLGTKVAPKTAFGWQEPDDASKPLSYELQIAADSGFQTTLLDKKGITGAGYTLGDAEKLEKTSEGAPYYWRLKATDAAANSGEWSGVSTFYVKSSIPVISDLLDKLPPIKGWFLFGLIAAGVLLVFFLGFAAGRAGGGGGGKDYY
jgi:hypothetical protein